MPRNLVIPLFLWRPQVRSGQQEQPKPNYNGERWGWPVSRQHSFSVPLCECVPSLLIREASVGSEPRDIDEKGTSLDEENWVYSRHFRWGASSNLESEPEYDFRTCCQERATTKFISAQCVMGFGVGRAR